MKQIKLTLGFSLLLLTMAGMMLTNFVILPFWVGDILTRETEHLRQLLSIEAAFDDPDDLIALPSSLQMLLADSPGGCVSWYGDSYPHGQGGNACQQGLQSLIASVIKTGTVQTTLSAISLFDLFTFRYLYVAVPMVNAKGTPKAVGAGIPLAHIVHLLWKKERIIAMYLLFNALILAALAFFRLFKAYVQPVDRMVEAAENYRGDGLPDIWTEKSTNELGQLAGSIQAMVQRIETDREKLARTVAELAEKNRQLQENQREMIRAEKLASVGRLAAGLAHEIGNPLGVTQGYLQLLSMDGNREDERAEYVAKALEELERVNNLIRQLLDYARTTKGESVSFEVHDLLTELSESLRVQPFLDGIRLDINLGAGNSIISADREQLRQVFLNCLLNSVDAIRACRQRGEGVITMKTSFAAPFLPGDDSPLLRIAIEDNGEGVPSELLDTVFDPFFTTKEPGAGTGLGLSVSLALIESMGGSIRLESIAGAGTTVLLLLPLVTEAAAGADVFLRAS